VITSSPEIPISIRTIHEEILESGQPKQCKRDKRFGTYIVRSLYRAGSLMDLQEMGYGSMHWIYLT
jgi:hypothetical protein